MCNGEANVNRSHTFRWRFALLAIVTGSFAIGLGPMGRAASPVADAAQKIFQTACAGCHGPDGRGTSANAKLLKAGDLLSPEVQAMSDAALFTFIAKGSKNMPPSEKTLGKEKIKALVAYLRAQAKRK